MSENRNPLESPPPHKSAKIQKEIPMHGGILQESDKKKLEGEIASRLKTLGSKFTQREIRDLLTAVETSRSLASLKEKLGEKVSNQANDRFLEDLLALSDSIRRGAAEGIKELRIDVSNVLKHAPSRLKQGTFFSERFWIVGRLENSELGKNLILDLTGGLVGALDSALAVLSLILHLLVDALRAPVDIYTALKETPKLEENQ
jgi:hypothetical protein